MARVFVPLPDRDFDVTEVAVPWRLLTRAGHVVTFATEHGGATPSADPRLLTGVLFGQLGADPEPKAFYRELEQDPAFRAPVDWSKLDVASYDGMILPGGHAPGMRQYLGSDTLRATVTRFWESGRPVAAICHGVLVLARAGVLTQSRTTCLPKYMERSAYWLTAWKLGRYYRTYPEYVEDEVKRGLRDPDTQFLRGPRVLTKRGTATDDTHAFVVDDGRYVSARWPGDAYLFARTFAAKL